MRISEITVIPDLAERDWDTFNPSWAAESYQVIKFDNNFEYRRYFNNGKIIIECNTNEKCIGYLILAKKYKFYQVISVAVDPKFRNLGIGLTMYKIAIIDLKLKVMSDFEQTNNGQRIWQRLKQQPNVLVQVYGNKLIALFDDN